MDVRKYLWGVTAGAATMAAAITYASSLSLEITQAHTVFGVSARAEFIALYLFLAAAVCFATVLTRNRGVRATEFAFSGVCVLPMAGVAGVSRYPLLLWLICAVDFTACWSETVSMTRARGWLLALAGATCAAAVFALGLTFTRA